MKTTEYRNRRLAAKQTEQVESLGDRKTCRLCGKSFATEAELVEHEVTAHPNVSGTKDLPRKQMRGSTGMRVSVLNRSAFLSLRLA